MGGTVANEILRAGYKVRGITRSAAKGDLCKEAFEKYGKDAFDYVVVQDSLAPSAYDEALKGRISLYE